MAAETSTPIDTENRYQPQPEVATRSMAVRLHEQFSHHQAPTLLTFSTLVETLKLDALFNYVGTVDDGQPLKAGEVKRTVTFANGEVHSKARWLGPDGDERSVEVTYGKEQEGESTTPSKLYVEFEGKYLSIWKYHDPNKDEYLGEHTPEEQKCDFEVTYSGSDHPMKYRDADWEDKHRYEYPRRPRIETKKVTSAYPHFPKPSVGPYGSTSF